MYQIAFTRVNNVGWKVVDPSPDIPKEVLNRFERSQNQNTISPKFNDGENANQVLTQLETDDKYVYLTKIKPNSGVDEHGRSIMFSQAFIFDRESFVNDIQSILLIKTSNFGLSLKESAGLKDESSLERYNSVTLEQCISALKIDINSNIYEMLVKSVINTVCSNTATLHIVCDCKETTVLLYMILIYYAVPLEFRRRISFSSREFPNNKQIKLVFCTEREESRSFKYFDTMTGENNCLTDWIINKYSEYGFLTKVTNAKPPQINDAYFRNLEKNLIKLYGNNVGRSTDLVMYNSISDIVSGNFDVITALSNTLDFKTFSMETDLLISRYMETVVANIDNQEISTTLLLKIGNRISNSGYEPLIESGVNIICHELNKQEHSVEEAVRILSNFPNRQSEAFKKMIEVLKKNNKGKNILLLLYEKIYKDLIESPKKLTDKVINEYLSEITWMYDCVKPEATRHFRSNVSNLIIKYYENAFSGDNDPENFVKLTKEVFNVYNSNEFVRDYGKNLENIYYWETYNFDEISFSPSGMQKYLLYRKRFEEKQVSGIKQYDYALKAFQLYEEVIGNFPRMKEIEEYTDYLFKHEFEFVTDSSKKKLSGVLLDAARKAHNDRHIEAKKEYCHIDQWISMFPLIRIETSNPVKYLIFYDILALTSRFGREYPESKLLINPEIREQFISYLKSFCLDEDNQKYKQCIEIANNALTVMGEAPVKTSHGLGSLFSFLGGKGKK